MTSPLIEPAELRVLIDSRQGLVLADVRYVLGGPSQYPEFLAGHLPGAQWVELDADLAGPPGPGGRHPLPDPQVFESAMRRIGVRPGDLVVAYDAQTSLSAARLWWLLTDGGVVCRVLNGGLAGWVADGLPLESGPAQSVPTGTVTIEPGRREQVSPEQILDGLGLGRVVVDVRTHERYAGESEPIDPVAGHIPGAVNVPSAGNHHSDGRFRSPAEIADRFAGIDAPVLSCGSGITAAQSLLALESAGLSGAIYPGSWSGWIADPGRPVATGRDPG